MPHCHFPCFCPSDWLAFIGCPMVNMACTENIVICIPVFSKVRCSALDEEEEEEEYEEEEEMEEEEDWEEDEEEEWEVWRTIFQTNFSEWCPQVGIFPVIVYIAQQSFVLQGITPISAKYHHVNHTLSRIWEFSKIT